VHEADLFHIKKRAGHWVHRPYKYQYHDGTVNIAGANRGYIRRFRRRVMVSWMEQNKMMGCTLQ
jgi:hypothetical protein